MTRAALEDYIRLVTELNEARAAYHEEELKALPGAQNLDGMPRSAGGAVRKVEEYGISLAEYAEILGLRRLERAVEQRKPEVVTWIAGRRNAATRKVLKLRVLDALPWKLVAARCGAGVSEDAVRMQYARAVGNLP